MRFLGAFTLATLLIGILWGCAPAQKRGASVEFRLVPLKNKAFALSAQTALPSDVCLMMHVTGTGKGLNRFPMDEGCGADRPNVVGLTVGTFSQGDAFEMEVPVGPARRFDLLAFPKSTFGGSCPVGASIQPGANGRPNLFVNGSEILMMSSPYFVATAKNVNITPGDNRVSMQWVTDANGNVGAPYGCGAAGGELRVRTPTADGGVIRSAMTAAFFDVECPADVSYVRIRWNLTPGTVASEQSKTAACSGGHAWFTGIEHIDLSNYVMGTLYGSSAAPELTVEGLSSSMQLVSGRSLPFGVQRGVSYQDLAVSGWSSSPQMRLVGLKDDNTLVAASSGGSNAENLHSFSLSYSGGSTMLSCPNAGCTGDYTTHGALTMQRGFPFIVANALKTFINDSGFHLGESAIASADTQTSNVFTGLVSGTHVWDQHNDSFVTVVTTDPDSVAPTYTSNIKIYANHIGGGANSTGVMFAGWDSATGTPLGSTATVGDAVAMYSLNDIRVKAAAGAPAFVAVSGEETLGNGSVMYMRCDSFAECNNPLKGKVTQFTWTGETVKGMDVIESSLGRRVVSVVSSGPTSFTPVVFDMEAASMQSLYGTGAGNLTLKLTPANYADADKAGKLITGNFYPPISAGNIYTVRAMNNFDADHPELKDHLMAGGVDGGYAVLYRSVDAGMNWFRVYQSTVSSSYVSDVRPVKQRYYNPSTSAYADFWTFAAIEVQSATATLLMQNGLGF